MIAVAALEERLAVVGRDDHGGARPVRARAQSREQLAEHYAEHEGKPFFDSLVSFITRGPAMLLVVEGPEDTWEVARTMIGATNCAKAAPGTIRGDLGIAFTENLVHGSDSAESAAREIGIFFPDLT